MIAVNEYLRDSYYQQPMNYRERMIAKLRYATTADERQYGAAKEVLATLSLAVLAYGGPF